MYIWSLYSQTLNKIIGKSKKRFWFKTKSSSSYSGWRAYKKTRNKKRADLVRRTEHITRKRDNDINIENGNVSINIIYNKYFLFTVQIRLTIRQFLNKLY